jgi:hypothetical protein
MTCTACFIVLYLSSFVFGFLWLVPHENALRFCMKGKVLHHKCILLWNWKYVYGASYHRQSCKAICFSFFPTSVVGIRVVNYYSFDS